MAAVTLVHIDSTAAPRSSRSVQLSIISLPDPFNDDLNDPSSSMREYMLVSCAHLPRTSPSAVAAGRQQPLHDIHEIQTVLPHSGKYASYLVGSRVVSNPSLHVSTRVDPLFFALAHLLQRRCVVAINDACKGEGALAGAGKKLEKWRPWDQALGDLPSPILRALGLDPDLTIDGVAGAGQLRHLMDVSDMCGDDLILCRFSEERAMRWLVAKFEKSLEGLRRRLREKKRSAAETNIELKSTQGGFGAFSSSFTLADEDPKAATAHGEETKNSSGGDLTESALSEEEEDSVRISALQLVCDYIPIEWRHKLSMEVGMADADWMGKKKGKSSSSSSGGEGSNASGEKRTRSSWEGSIGQEDADALLQYTVGGCGKSSSVITPSDKQKEVQNAQSVGLKRLAKVNTKGMKSLTSFFGASKKKKTK